MDSVSHDLDRLETLAWGRSAKQAQNLAFVRIVETREKGRAVVARRPFAAGAVVMIGFAEAIEPSRTHLSVQTGWHRHVLMQEPAVVMNHSCDPTTRVVENRYGAFDFLAIRAIGTGEEITFDYATTEFEPLSNFVCQCGSRECRGRWGGFIALPVDNTLRRHGHVAAYLKSSPPPPA